MKAISPRLRRLEDQLAPLQRDLLREDVEARVSELERAGEESKNKR